MNDWNIHHGDCIPHMAIEMDAASVDLAVLEKAKRVQNDTEEQERLFKSLRMEVPA